MVKKLLALLLIGIVVFGTAACRNNGSTESSDSTTAEKESGSAQENHPKADGDSLVVYFSATGNTKAVAETIADKQDADLQEMVPEEPYTEEELDYNDRSSRSTKEQNDENSRPKIAKEIANIENYDVIYVGYPIWWGDMPRILYTFFDAYDFSGKTIVPFCTSGGSGLSGTTDDIKELEPDAEVLEGLEVDGSSAANADDEVDEWISSIGLE